MDDDIYWSILEAVRTSLETVSGIPPVALRYDLRKLEEKTPLVIVAPSVSKIRKCPKSPLQFGKGVWWDYPVLVALVTGNNQQLSTGLRDHLKLVINIRDQLFQVELAGVTAVFDTDLVDEELSKFAAVADSNYRVKGYGMWYTVASHLKG